MALKTKDDFFFMSVQGEDKIDDDKKFDVAQPQAEASQWNKITMMDTFIKDNPSFNEGTNAKEIETVHQPSATQDIDLGVQSQTFASLNLIKKTLNKGRVLEIRKLNKKINIIRKKKGPNQLLEKNKIKVEKLLEEIDLMKNTNLDELTGKADVLLKNTDNSCYKDTLENESTCQKLLQNIQKEIVHLKLIGNKYVINNISKIRSDNYSIQLERENVVCKKDTHEIKNKKLTIIDTDMKCNDICNEGSSNKEIEIMHPSSDTQDIDLEVQELRTLIKKTLKKGRILEIRKLTKRITIIRKKKEQLEENKRNIDKHIEEIDLMKNINLEELTEKVCVLLMDPENSCYKGTLQNKSMCKKLLQNISHNNQEEILHLKLICNKYVRNNLLKIRSGNYSIQLGKENMDCKKDTKKVESNKSLTNSDGKKVSSVCDNLCHKIEINTSGTNFNVDTNLKDNDIFREGSSSNTEKIETETMHQLFETQDTDLEEHDLEALIKKTLKKGRFFEIRKLTRKNTIRGKMKGTDQQLEKNKRKIEKHLEEIELMKDVNLEELIRKVTVLLQDPENSFYKGTIESESIYMELLQNIPCENKKEIVHLKLIANKYVRNNLLNIKSGNYPIPLNLRTKNVDCKKETKTKKVKSNKSTKSNKSSVDSDKQCNNHSERDQSNKIRDDADSIELKDGENTKHLIDKIDDKRITENETDDHRNTNDSEQKTVDSFFLSSLSDTKQIHLSYNDSKDRKDVQSKQQSNKRNKKPYINYVLQKMKKNKSGNNRLGQRARRRLWEQLYGEEAMHFNDSKKSFIASKHNVIMNRNRFENSKFRSQFKGKEIQKFNKSVNIQPSKNSREEKTELHPSWEARRAQKLKEHPVEFKGTKITFDD